MKRICMTFLEQWLTSPTRKPLVIRGARQVGKTWLVRNLATTQKKKLVELNFEKRPSLATLFAPNEPEAILLNLSAALEQRIDPEECLLFLDEIQAAPELLAKLRWFAEDMPQLPVIAAGSLLEFVLERPTFSMPVGRIGYMYVEPFSFEEFLLAHNKDELVNYIKSCTLQTAIPQAVHDEAMRLFREYVIIGGMPQVVASWIHHRTLDQIHQLQLDLLATYRDDSAKYRGRLSNERLDEVMTAVPKFLAEKFVYTRVNPQAPLVAIKQSLDLLCMARVCHRVACTAANGLPLGAEINDKYFKVIFIDVGLCSVSLGLSFDQIQKVEELTLINKGGIAEQVTGQLLRTLAPSYVEPSLYYWQRTEKGASAEIDYIIQHKSNVVPVEVKAGSTGSLKSLHLFMALKERTAAVRINSDLPTLVKVDTKFGQEQTVQYQLLSVPFYLLGELHRLLSLSI